MKLATFDKAVELRTLQVTQEDIDKSREKRLGPETYCSVMHCPIGFALQRIYGVSDDLVRAHPDKLMVDSNRASFNMLLYWVPSQTVRRFMNRWDRLMQAKPHTFKM